MQSHHLLSAARSGDWDEVQRYLDAGKDINCRDTVGTRCANLVPISLAVTAGPAGGSTDVLICHYFEV
jgi:hypothetical protein